MRVLVALGGNAMIGPDGDASPDAQRAAIGIAMQRVAEVAGRGEEVVLTHGNGPQVGNILVKNELAAHVVPPVSLDWCVAQTQGTIGFTILNALEGALAERGIERSVASLVTRVLVDEHDPGFTRPAKPIGRHVAAEEAERYTAHGQVWQDRGAKGWRRVVASPRPLEILDASAVEVFLRSGVIVVAAGGGGVPVTRGSDGTLAGVEAVVDKDLAAALLARTIGADMLVIATDVPCAVVDFGTPQARPLGRVSTEELRTYAADGHFSSGSMGPKVEAALQFVESGGGRAVITSLDRITEAVTGGAGTRVEPETSARSAGRPHTGPHIRE